MHGIGVHGVFVDSNVLYSRTLRDWLALLYLNPHVEVFRVFWSEEVLADVIHHLRKDHPDWSGVKISAIRDRLTEVFEDGRVKDIDVDGTYQGSDPDDAHIHAAAVACRADILLTANVSDFVTAKDDTLLPYDVMTPDEFFVWVDDVAPLAVRGVTKEQRDYWFGQHGEVHLPRSLCRAGAPEFAERVRLHQLNL